MLRTPRAAVVAIFLVLATANASAQQTRNPVIVELFTSEGCSSCPPADAVLAQFDRQQPVPTADVIVLGEHVDYWDGLGWRDRFSSSNFTERQTQYRFAFKLDDIYTPQAVVNGSAQINGTDRDRIFSAILDAAAQTIPLRIATVDLHRDYVNFTLQNGPATHPEPVTLYAALVDPTDTTEVHGGENNSRTLHHAGVVRTLSVLTASSHLKDLAGHPYTVQLRVPASIDGMRLVVFAQTKRIGAVLASTSCVLSIHPTASRATAPFPTNQCPVAALAVASAQ